MKFEEQKTTTHMHTNGDEAYWAKVYAGQIAAQVLTGWDEDNQPKNVIDQVCKLARTLAKAMCKEGEG